VEVRAAAVAPVVVVPTLVEEAVVAVPVNPPLSNLLLFRREAPLQSPSGLAGLVVLQVFLLDLLVHLVEIPLSDL